MQVAGADSDWDDDEQQVDPVAEQDFFQGRRIADPPVGLNSGTRCASLQQRRLG